METKLDKELQHVRVATLKSIVGKTALKIPKHLDTPRPYPLPLK